MIYGMLAAKSCLLTDIVDQLHEDTKKINSVERLSRHLEKGIPQKASVSYLQTIKKWGSTEPIIHIDDSDVTKPDGYKFEALGIVRDGSESTSTKMFTKKDITLPKPVFLQAVIIRSAFFQEYILLLKKTTNQLMPLLLKLWNRGLHCLKKQHSQWTGVMMITKCF